MNIKETFMERLPFGKVRHSATETPYRGLADFSVPPAALDDTAPAGIDFPCPPANELSAHLRREAVRSIERHSLRSMEHLLRLALSPDEFAEDRASAVAGMAYEKTRILRRAARDGYAPPDLADHDENYGSIEQVLSKVLGECDRGFGLDEAVCAALGKIERRQGQLDREDWDCGILRTRRGDVNLEILMYSIIRFHQLGTEPGRIAFTSNVGIKRVLSLDRRHVIASMDLLIENAIAAIPCRGSIHVDVREVAEADDIFLQFTVTNSGDGIAQRDLESLVAGSFTTKGAGHGTGLASVKEISLHYMGSVRLVSSLTRGTHVIVRWSMDLIPEVPRTPRHHGTKKEVRHAA